MKIRCLDGRLSPRVRFLGLGFAPLLVLACGGNGAAVGGIDGGGDAPGATDTGTKSDTGSKPMPDGGMMGQEATTMGDTGGGMETGPTPDTGTPETGTPDVTTPVDTGTPEAGGPDVQLIPDAGPLCGNGMIDGTEQCDDGNNLNLDGCDSACNYEMVSRLTAFTIASTKAPTAMNCSPSTNVLGTKAITSLALGQLNPPVQKDIAAGTLNIFTETFGMQGDLTGLQNASGITIALLAGNLDPAKGTWPGNNPIDWWFLADHAAVTNGLPLATLGGGVDNGGTLTAGPGTVSIPFLGGVVKMLDAKIAATIGTMNDVPAPPPATLASGLTVFETLTGSNNQGLCGNITAGSLSLIPVPSALTSGTTKCTEGYTACASGDPVGPSCNSLLDVIIGGCTVLVVQAVAPTQPDVAPPGGTITHLTAAQGTKKVTVTAADSDEAYSLYVTFSGNRAHFTGQTCTGPTDCQAGQTCSASGSCE